MLMSRRESVLSTVVQTIGVELQEAKNRARRDGKRSVMTLSITAWQQHSEDIRDMLDGGDAVPRNGKPLRCPLRSVADAMRLGRTALINLTITISSQKKWNEIALDVKTTTRPHGLDAKLILTALTFYDNLTDPTTSIIQATRSTTLMKYTYAEFRLKTETQFTKHVLVLEKMDGHQINKYVLLRRNKARAARRMLMLLKHLDTVHFGDCCPFCCS